MRPPFYGKLVQVLTRTPLLFFLCFTHVNCAEEESEPEIDAPSMTEMLMTGPYGAGVHSMTLVDTSRSTPENGTYKGSPERELITEVWYPIDTENIGDEPSRDAMISTQGPFPVVVHSHGFLSYHNDNKGLSIFLASHGYIVVAPDFPLSNRSAPGGPTIMDTLEQAGDISFVLDTVLEMGEDSESVLANGVNEDKIAFSGLSLGAYTTMLAALDPERADPRVDAILPMAVAGCYVPKHFFDVPGPPMVLLHGTADAILPYEANAPMVYDLAQPSKRLISLINGTHTGFADISADVFQYMEHADEVGCIAIAGTVPDFDTLPFDEVFGEVEFVNSDCPFPCEGVELIDGMNPLRQIDLLFAVARAFLDETLKEDHRAGTFLDEVLSMEPDVDVIYQHTQ